jgi:hypothetical protein
MPRQKSEAKSLQARNSPALSAWRRACKSLGYISGETFKPVPKKGTAAYNKLYEVYQMELQVGNSHFVRN